MAKTLFNNKSDFSGNNSSYKFDDFLFNQIILYKEADIYIDGSTGYLLWSLISLSVVFKGSQSDIQLQKNRIRWASSVE